jgi:hypothetical protein
LFSLLGVVVIILAGDALPWLKVILLALPETAAVSCWIPACWAAGQWVGTLESSELELKVREKE